MAPDTKWLKEKRREKGLTVYDLAALVGINAVGVSRKLNGTRKMTIEEVTKFATALGVSRDELMTRMEGKMPASPIGDGSAKAGIHIEGFGESPQPDLAGHLVKHPGFGFMKGLITFADDFDPTEPAFPDWEEYAEQKYGKDSKLVE